MIYQLPNGKIVHLTISQFLAMTDDDLKYIDELNLGTSCSNPFANFEKQKEEEDVVIDRSIELLSDDDEPSYEINIDHILSDDEPLI